MYSVSNAINRYCKKDRGRRVRLRAAGEETQCYRIVGRGWGVETSLRRYLTKALRHRGNHSTIWGAAFQAEGAASAKALWRAHGWCF